MMNFKALCLLLLVFLTACTTTSKKEDVKSRDNIPNKREIMILPPVETRVFYMKPVVKKLLRKAKLKFGEKNYHATINLLEMAIDISPNNPFTWQQLALVRLKQQNYLQAEQLAVKSNVLGEENNELRMKNWQIIAAAKRGQKKRR